MALLPQLLAALCGQFPVPVDRPRAAASTAATALSPAVLFPVQVAAERRSSQQLLPTECRSQNGEQDRRRTCQWPFCTLEEHTSQPAPTVAIVTSRAAVSHVSNTQRFFLSFFLNFILLLKLSLSCSIDYLLVFERTLILLDYRINNNML